MINSVACCFLYSLLLITKKSAQLICLGCKIIQNVVQLHNYSYSYLQFDLLITNYIQVCVKYKQSINYIIGYKNYLCTSLNYRNRQRVPITNGFWEITVMIKVSSSGWNVKMKWMVKSCQG